jgi:hypothetical protein
MHTSPQIIASSAFSIPAGHSAVLGLRLNKTGRALLGADHVRLGATLTVLSTTPRQSRAWTGDIELARD